MTFFALLRRFGSAAAAIEALPPIVAPGHSRSDGARPRRNSPRSSGSADRLLCWGEPLYPALLAAVEDAPPVLTVFGRPELLPARRSSRWSARATPRRTAAGSPASWRPGSARPASSSPRAWRAASTRRRISARSTAARSRSLAGGADIVYPEENRGLYEAMRTRGAILAELPLRAEPQARHFPRRNRIISGLALGVVVVEAAAKSGSLITARYALEQGREVFAVPGSPLDPRCRGCNDLLAQRRDADRDRRRRDRPARAAAARAGPRQFDGRMRRLRMRRPASKSRGRLSRRRLRSATTTRSICCSNI